MGKKKFLKCVSLDEEKKKMAGLGYFHSKVFSSK